MTDRLEHVRGWHGQEKRRHVVARTCRHPATPGLGMAPAGCDSEQIGALGYLGITRRSASPTARERLRGDEDTLRRLLERLGAAFPGRLALATCERFELYTVSTETAARDAIAILSDHAGVSADELARHADFRSDHHAARHLLRVAGGLESRVLGESHILGQVRRAYLLASDTGSLDPCLCALGRAAIHTGKRIRNETAINRTARSLVTFALDHLRGSAETPRAPKTTAILAGYRPLPHGRGSVSSGALRNKTVVIVGAGTLANDIMSGLTEDRPAELIVVSRHVERARRLADRLGGNGVPPEDMAWALHRADVVIACAAAGSFLIRPGDIRPSRTRPLHLLDLGVPRNVDPACAERRCVELTHLDDLPCRTNEHRSCLRHADRIVEQELARYLKWKRARSVPSLPPYQGGIEGGLTNGILPPCQGERRRVGSLPPYQGGIEGGLTTNGHFPQPLAGAPNGRGDSAMDRPNEEVAA